MALAEIKALLEQHKDDAEVQAYLAELAKPTLDGVKQFLTAGKDQAEVKALAGTLVTADAVRGFLEANDEGKKLFGSLADKRVTDAIATYRDKTVPGLVAAEVAKLNPEDTPDQKRIKVLETGIAEERAARTREALKTRALGFVAQKGLPADVAGLADMLLGQDEATTDANLARFAEVFDASVGLAVAGKFKAGGPTPGPVDKAPAAAITREQLAKMAPAEVVKARQEGKLDHLLRGASAP